MSGKPVTPKSHAQKAIFDRLLAQRRPQTPAKNAVWFYNQGVVLEKQGQVDAAVKSYRQALELSPGYSSALLNLGRLLAETGQFVEAVAHYQEALRIRPDYADAHNNLGAALAGLGRIDEAMSHYQEALRIRPDYAGAHLNLGVALAGRGQLDEAVAHLQKALSLVSARNDRALADVIRARIRLHQSDRPSPDPIQLPRKIQP